MGTLFTDTLYVFKHHETVEILL